MTITSPSRLSYSSVSTYAECGQKWLLSRGHKVPEATWFATLAGSTIHHITELRDRLELMGIPPAEQVAFTPTFEADFIPRVEEVIAEGREVRASGRVTKEIGVTGGPNKKDRDWWLHWGPIYLERWTAWKAEFGWTLLDIPDIGPAIELGFDVTLGGERVIGYIDRVYTSPTTGIGVFDLKTGAEPASKLQLATYGVGMKEQYGVDVDWGIYWRPAGGDETGGLSQAVDLHSYSREALEAMYAGARRGIEAGVFMPNVTSMCSGCTARRYCWAVAGEKSNTIPVIAEIINHATGEVASSEAIAQVGTTQVAP